MLMRFDDAYIRDVLSHLKELCISVYGLDAEEYIEITRQDNYNDMIEGIARLLRLGGRKIVVYTRQIKKRSADFIDAWLSDISDRSGVEKADIRFSHGLTTYANWSVFDEKSKLPHDARWVHRAKTEGQCALPLVSMQIYSNGNVSICGCADYNSDTELQIGNVNDQTLKQMLKSEKFKKLWDWNKFGIPEFCQSCSMYRPISVFKELQAGIANPLGVFNGG